MPCGAQLPSPLLTKVLLHHPHPSQGKLSSESAEHAGHSLGAAPASGSSPPAAVRHLEPGRVCTCSFGAGRTGFHPLSCNPQVSTTPPPAHKHLFLLSDPPSKSGKRERAGAAQVTSDEIPVHSVLLTYALLPVSQCTPLSSRFDTRPTPSLEENAGCKLQ